jgi:hypothetical protein
MVMIQLLAFLVVLLALLMVIRGGARPPFQPW